MIATTKRTSPKARNIRALNCWEKLAIKLPEATFGTKWERCETINLWELGLRLRLRLRWGKVHARIHRARGRWQHVLEKLEHFLLKFYYFLNVVGVRHAHRSYVIVTVMLLHIAFQSLCYFTFMIEPHNSKKNFLSGLF
jgi:hypothetical protein